MKKFNIFLTSLILFTGFVYCEILYNKVENIPADKSVIYVYRIKSFIGCIVAFDVDIGTEPIGKLYQGRYISYITTPGTVKIWVKTPKEDISSIVIEAKPGDVYFVRCIPTFGEPVLELVTKEEGYKEISKYRPISGTEVGNKYIVGFGIGVPYGGVGFNFEFCFGHFSFGVGFGRLITQIGWSIGGRLHMFSFKHSFKSVNPRISFFYGTVGIIEKKPYWPIEFTEYETVTGTGLGVGVGMKFSKFIGGNLDIMFLNPNWPANVQVVDTGIKISAGINYFF